MNAPINRLLGVDRTLLSTWFAIYLYLSFPRAGIAEDHVSVKWQDYREDDDRIRVISRYLGFEKQINASLVLKGHGVHDAISGATPIGTPSNDGGETVPLSDLSDVREAGVVDLVWTQGVHVTNFQYSYSEESDFLSRGLAVSRKTEFNKRNTGFSYGVSFVDDDVNPTFFDEKKEKESWDYFIGLSQVLDPNTVVELNFTYGDIDGYLSDPYKLIRQEKEVLPGLFLPLSHGENRPESRARRIVFFNLKRFFDKVGGSLDSDVRYFNDSWGITSWTYDLEWYQKIGERFVVRPNVRWYSQSAADFYVLDLNGAPFEAFEDPLGLPPHYSSDYRLAKMRTVSYGLKVVYKLSERIHFDAAFERYEMEGRDGVTPQAAFPDAEILTLGGTLWF